MKKVMTVFGTRPEAIKMAPLVRALNEASDIKAITCVTGQHSEMLAQVMDFFGLETHYDLKIMTDHPQLTQVYSRVLDRLTPIFDEEKPDLVMVHGDTATTAGASMGAFMKQISIAHVEAGLRTGDLYSPWPEEFNRRLTALVTRLHFAPTEEAKKNLLVEGVPEEDVEVTGNTVIDALFLTTKKLMGDEKFKNDFFHRFPFAQTQKKLLLVTGHRRENFGEGLENICQALEQMAQREDVEIIYPIHLNPNVKEAVSQQLSGKNNIHLIPPLDYKDFVFLMKHSYLIISDSGGVQEEAPSLGKPVLVTRNTTERPEAVRAGTVKLVGTDFDNILRVATELIENKEAYIAASRSHNPYGDGNATPRIMERIRHQFRL